MIQAQGTASSVLSPPIDIAKMFVPSGWMGDGENNGSRYVQLIPKVCPKSRPGASSSLCIQVSYRPGAVGWAGVFWQYPANNWGKESGRSIRGATRLVFWAYGEKGGEIVEFKSGGINTSGAKYHDSYEASLGNVALTKDWKRYEIDLKGQNLSTAIGAFAWVATAASNPGGLTFYRLDAMSFE